MAQQGGVGLVVYNRKEGRALGEVTKFPVYNARRPAATARKPISPAPNAWRACRTCASVN